MTGVRYVLFVVCCLVCVDCGCLFVVRCVLLAVLIAVCCVVFVVLRVMCVV